MKGNVIFLVFALLVFLLLSAVASRRVVPIPHDDIHTVISDNASCTACHGTGQQAPLKAGHPPKEQCLICHKVMKDCHPDYIKKT